MDSDSKKKKQEVVAIRSYFQRSAEIIQSPSLFKTVNCSLQLQVIVSCGNMVSLFSLDISNFQA